MRESELFLPIKHYFETMGFEVDGEVKDCDMLCHSQDMTIAVELKNELNFKVFMQAAKRQKMFEMVYIGIWTPKNFGSRAFRDKMYMLNRLGLGLLVVSKRTKEVKVYTEPLIHILKDYQTRNKKKREKLVKELKLRRLKSNVGGVTGKEVMTVFRENSLIVLGTLEKEGPMSGAKMKAATGITNSYRIMYDNHYNWFVKEGKGVYNISHDGLKALDEYQSTITQLLSSPQEIEVKE
jgi:hypothetical protein